MGEVVSGSFKTLKEFTLKEMRALRQNVKVIIKLVGITPLKQKEAEKLAVFI